MNENTAGKPVQPSNPRPPLAMTWLRPDKSIRHTPGTEYATDGTYVFERWKGHDGRFQYRRAHWSAIAVDIEWADLDQGIWTVIDEAEVPKGKP